MLKRKEGYIIVLSPLFKGRYHHMDINYLSPYIRVAMDSIIEAPWTLAERVIFDYELLYIMEGEVLITVEDKSYDGRPGDVFLFKPKEKHSITVMGASRFRQPHLHFDLNYRQDSLDVKVSFKKLTEIEQKDQKKFRRDMTKEPGMQLPNKIVLRNIKLFEEMLFDIIKEFEAKSPYYELSLKGLFLRLWTYLLRENYWNENPLAYNNMDELMRVKEYLNCHTDREISLDDLSRMFNISKYHLIRLFNKVFSISPVHYHQMMRMEKAKKLIQFSNASITEISEILGFSCINSFSRAFRKMEGVPPTFYRVKN